MRGILDAGLPASQLPTVAKNASFSSIALHCLVFAQRWQEGEKPLFMLFLRLLKWWLGAESNRRHKDFQSSALPTELPSPPVAVRPKHPRPGKSG